MYDIHTQNVQSGISVRSMYDLPTQNIQSGISVRSMYDLPTQNIQSGISVRYVYDLHTQNIQSDISVRYVYAIHTQNIQPTLTPIVRRPHLGHSSGKFRLTQNVQLLFRSQYSWWVKPQQVILYIGSCSIFELYKWS